MANLLKSLDEQLSDNLQQHGHYLTDPEALDEEQLNAAISQLAPFVPEDRWPQMREELLRIIRASREPR
ncbi:hypothetical protein [Microvirga lotononidis]|uniref:Uncharacterized protein n=1 Tax=Microvirga lotononidis TaxID=864069 RepID=I4Z3I1_9HYPH|nr:hypothetical protein [Microvirga lotononidis]EIM30773.1 hypothetical protein MicloDRAFT_00003000 [Microvirga lotononidis]WQO31727.1 hypothetical protein U0023_30655 [Microvirga lotononidis]